MISDFIDQSYFALQNEERTIKKEVPPLRDL